MIKKIIVSICLLFSLTMLAQQGTASPYSYYGVGEIKFRGTFDNRAMGGLSIFTDSTHVNIQNPASTASLKLVNFTLGGMYGTTKSETTTESGTNNRSSIDYIAGGIPMGRFGAYFGVLPYTTVGYNEHFYDSTTQIDKKSTGIGGINKGFFGLGFKIISNLSVGLDFNYNFGGISTKDIVYKNDVQYGSRESNNSDISGVNYNAGLMWNSKVGKNSRLFASFRYTPQSDLKSENTRNIATVKPSAAADPPVVESQDVVVENTTMILPRRISAGAGFGEERKWLIGAEFTLSDSDGFSNRFSDINGSSFKTSRRYIVGGYYIPKHNSYNNYFKTITYRAGIRYDSAGLIVKEEPINEAAFTLGAGLPVGGRFSNVNVGLEFGQRGTTNVGLVKETFFNFMVSFSLNDQWFAKRKFN